jgi:hypothetical protein
MRCFILEGLILPIFFEEAIAFTNSRTLFDQARLLYLIDAMSAAFISLN